MTSSQAAGPNSDYADKPDREKLHWTFSRTSVRLPCPKTRGT